jgi:thiol-disulfide isomerase/thioredoxin
MHRLFTCFHVFLLTALAVLLPIYWALMIFFGSGSGYYRQARFGPIAYNTENLMLFTFILAPTVFFSLFYVVRRLSRDGQRLIWWRSLPFMSNWYALQTTLLLALLLAFGTPWSGMMKTDWSEVLSKLSQGQQKPTPPSDENLKYPDLPLQIFDPYNWSIKDINGNIVPMTAFKGKAVFLNFWATWCGYCIYEFPNIQKLYDAVKDTPNLAFIFLSPEDPEVVKKWAETQEYTFPLYTIARTELPAEFTPSGFPTTFMLAPDGRIAFRHSGFAAWDGEKTQAFLKALAEIAAAEQEMPNQPEQTNSPDMSNPSDQANPPQ